nr:MAG TPA: hypothetical protein [Bacteriophage sp.]
MRNLFKKFCYLTRCIILSKEVYYILRRFWVNGFR